METKDKLIGIAMVLLGTAFVILGVAFINRSNTKVNPQVPGNEIYNEEQVNEDTYEQEDEYVQDDIYNEF